MSNPFNCPDGVYTVMKTGVGPQMLQAINFLGPEKVQWHRANPPVNGATGGKSSLVHWRFADKCVHATYKDIVSVAAKAGFHVRDE